MLVLFLFLRQVRMDLRRELIFIVPEDAHGSGRDAEPNKPYVVRLEVQVIEPY